MEVRLREVEQRFYDMVHHSPVMIWESDSKGRLQFLNNYWSEFTGNDLPTQLGNELAEQLHPDDLHFFIDVIQKALLRRSSFSLDHRIKNAAGEYRWVMNSGIPRFSEDSEFLGLRGSCIDITDRKIRELEALNQAYAEGKS